LEQLEIERVQALNEAQIISQEEVERKRIESDDGLDDVRISHQAKRRKLEIDRDKEVEEASMEKVITLYKKSLDESAAAAQADLAKAKAIQAAEQVKTTSATEEAKRAKSVDLMLAEKEAQEKSIAAKAEKVRSAVEAEAQKLINEAENVLTDEARQSLFKRKMLEHVEGIVSASVKPLEKINDIKIMQLGGNGSKSLGWDGQDDNGGSSGGSPTDEIINSALRYRVQAPMVDSLLGDIGVDGSNISKSGGLLNDAASLNRMQWEQQRLKDSKAKSAEDKGKGNEDKEVKS